MKITIRNMRGLKSADFEITTGNLTLVGGPNEAGKSSLAMAVRCALSGVALPPGVPKKDAVSLVTDGAAEGRVEIVTPQGSATLLLPDARINTAGRPPYASPLAAGLESLLDMNNAERISALTQILASEPDEATFVKALIQMDWPEDDEARVHRRAGKAEDMIAQMMERKGRTTDAVGVLANQLRLHGWDGLHKVKTDEGRKLKAQWEAVTNSNYGKRAAADWKPAEWPAGFIGDDLAALEQSATAARVELEQALKSSGASQAERQAKRELAARLEERTKLVAAAQAALDAATEAHKQAEQAARDLPNASRDPVQTCPHCEKHITLTMTAGKVVLGKADKVLTDKELQDRRHAKAAADGEAGNRLMTKGHRQRDLNTAAMELAQSEDAVAWLAAHPDGDAGDAVDVTAIRDRAANFANLAAMVEKRDKAAALNEAINRTIMLLEVLAPTGLRRTTLQRALTEFNTEILARLCEYASWKPVALNLADDTVQIRYGGRLYQTISTSALWRVQVVLQLGIALRQQADLVVLDGGDILADKLSRQGLLDMCLDHPFPVIATIAYPNGVMPPDLASGDTPLGNTIHIQDGVARVLGSPP
jgi:energy-coupling factor transporter ATP-binding protein EcfA2